MTQLRSCSDMPHRISISVLATRTEPPLPLPALRAQNQLLEIDVATLRFDLDETQQFLEHEGLGPFGLGEAQAFA